MKPQLALLLGLTVLSAGPSLGAEVFVPENELTGVAIQGEIVEGDFEKVLMALADLRRRNTDPSIWFTNWYLHINSSGEDVREAMKIGHFVSANLMEVSVHHSFSQDVDSGKWDLAGYGDSRTAVFVDKSGSVLDEIEGVETMKRNGVCYSACALIWFASPDRDSLDGRIGIHRPRFSEDMFGSLSLAEAERAYDALNIAVRKYLQDMDVPQHTIDLMFATPSDEVLLVTREEHEYLWHTPPAYDEWLRAKSPSLLTAAEEADYQSPLGGRLRYCA